MNSLYDGYAAALQGRHVVVCGGSSGLGRAVALMAQRHGARVSLIGRSVQSVDGFTGISADLGRSEDIRRAAASLTAVDHLVVTSGTRSESLRLEALDLQQLQQAYQVKLFGVLELIQQLLPVLHERASITLTSGLLARRYQPGGLIKSGLNAALEASAKVLARELAPRRVNVVSPGVFDTDLWGAADSPQRQARMQQIAQSSLLGRVGQPEEAASLYLQAICNQYMSGSVLDIDGGGLL